MDNSVKLISITQPIIEEAATSEELIAFCARVSNPSNQANINTSEKLLRYCIKNQHWSIFEMVDVTIEIECARDIGRQILRHRSFNFQEFSQRYAEVQGFTWREGRLQDSNNRQNSIQSRDRELADIWQELQTDVLIAAKKSYKRALELGIAKECARVVLPEGMTMSRMYMKGNLRSWIHYCNLRRGSGTQKEHKEIANKCWDIISEQFKFLKVNNDEVFLSFKVKNLGVSNTVPVMDKG
jgi:thymidylate synthase (FAD)